MITINLLPEAYRKAKTTSAQEIYQSPFVLGAVGLLLLVGIAILLFGVKSKTISGAFARKLCKCIYDANDEFAPLGTHHERMALFESFIHSVPDRVRLV